MVMGYKVYKLYYEECLAAKGTDEQRPNTITELTIRLALTHHINTVRREILCVQSYQLVCVCLCARLCVYCMTLTP